MWEANTNNQGQGDLETFRIHKKPLELGSELETLQSSSAFWNAWKQKLSPISIDLVELLYFYIGSSGDIYREKLSQHKILKMWKH